MMWLGLGGLGGACGLGVGFAVAVVFVVFVFVVIVVVVVAVVVAGAVESRELASSGGACVEGGLLVKTGRRAFGVGEGCIRCPLLCVVGGFAGFPKVPYMVAHLTVHHTHNTLMKQHYSCIHCMRRPYPSVAGANPLEIGVGDGRLRQKGNEVMQ